MAGLLTDSHALTPSRFYPVAMSNCQRAWWASQQRDCSGLSPDSLLIRRVEPTFRNQSVANIVYFFWILIQFCYLRNGFCILLSFRSFVKYQKKETGKRGSSGRKIQRACLIRADVFLFFVQKIKTFVQIFSDFWKRFSLGTDNFSSFALMNH